MPTKKMTTHPCTHCNFKAKNRAGLSSHMRSHKTLAMDAPEPAETTVDTTQPPEPQAMPAPTPAPAPQDEAPAESHAHDEGAVCKHCNVLPVGSVELVSLLLVLVFALSAVLLTSIYVIETRI